jgi:hypothetical protein
MQPPVDSTIKSLLNSHLGDLEAHFGGDFVSFSGPILDGIESAFLKVLEDLASDKEKRKALYLMLTTNGGSAIAVERIVNILRHHYDEVNFIVPDCAYSAGTILCMSGDSIHMDYYSVLGPIDPQVKNKEGKYVPALGYLDKVKELVGKKQLSKAEFLILKDMDLAELRAYEQAKELTVELLKKWLVKYKFKNWSMHRTNPDLKNQTVSGAEKQLRAEEIASALSDNTRWKSHGRPINIEALKELRLEIEDYSGIPERKEKVRIYYNLLSDYIQKNALQFFFHTRRFI